MFLQWRTKSKVKVGQSKNVINKENGKKIRPIRKLKIIAKEKIFFEAQNY